MQTEGNDFLFTDGWEKDWHVANGDEQLSRKLIPIFEAYLNDLHQNGVSKSTFKRHQNACSAIGSHIIHRVYGYELDKVEESEPGIDILLRYIDADEGPLVFQSYEAWQREVFHEP
jgi:hypothetical protein